MESHLVCSPFAFDHFQPVPEPAPPPRKPGRPRNPLAGWVTWDGSRLSKPYRVRVGSMQNGVRKIKFLGMFRDYDTAYAVLAAWRRAHRDVVL